MLVEDSTADQCMLCSSGISERLEDCLEGLGTKCMTCGLKKGSEHPIKVGIIGMNPS